MDTQPIFNKTARNLTLVYLLSLSFLAVLAIGSQWFIRQSLNKQTNQSDIINQAGRQRMLSQRIAKLSLLIEREPGSAQQKDWAEQLASNTQLWKQVHQDLIQGGLLPVQPNTAIQNQLQDLTPVLNEIANHAEKLTALAKATPNAHNQALVHVAVNTILANEPIFLQGMEAITLQYSQEAKASVLTLKNTELLLFAFTLLVLTGLGVFFFRPTVKRCLELMNNLQQLTEKSQKAEAALITEQKFTHAILEATPGILYLHDTQEDTTIFVNKHITNILGYTCQDIQAMENQFIRSVLHPNDRAKVLAHKEQVRRANSSEVLSVEYRMKHKNGHFIWLHSREMVFSHNAQGVPTQTLTIALDINQDKQNLENLEKSEAQYRLIVENATDMIYELDAKGYFTYANPILKKALGYSEEELLQLRYDKLILHSHQHLAIGFYKKQLLVEENESYLELPLLHKDGHTLWFGINTRLEIKDQRVIRIRAIARDITAQRLAEETALRAKEVFEATSDIVSMSDQRGITYLNQPGKYLLGYTNEEDLSGKTIEAFHTQASAENIQKVAHPIALQEGVWLGESTFLTKQGKEIPVSQMVIAHKNPDGSLKYLSTIARDISETKRAAQEMNNLKNLLSSVLDSSPSGIMAFKSLRNAAGQIEDLEWILINKTADQLIGEGFQLVGKRFRQEKVCDSGPMNGLFESYTQVIETGTPLHFTHQYEKEQKLCWLQFIAVKMEDGLVVTFQDVTEQQTSDEKLVSSRKMLAESQRLARLGSWELDLEMTGKVTWSEETFRLLELEPNGITPSLEEYIQLIHPEDAPLLINKIHQIMDDGQPYEVELRLLLPDKSIKHTLSRGKMEYEEGKQVKLVGIIQDVTERKLAEIELRKAKEEAELSMKAKEMFLSTMSHEIRTPMNAVIGMTYLLLQENPKPHQVQNLQTLQFAAQNLLVLINDILDFSKIESGKIVFEEIDFSLFNLINGVKNSLQFQIEEKRIQLITRLDSQIPPTMMGDPVRLSQVLTNLISNAIKFTEKGSVTVEVGINRIENANLYIDFSVTDTGIGISADKLVYIFESFAQASTDTTRKFGGTGLGLTITKRLLELQQSQIQVESTLGKGSRFFFTLAMKQSIKKELHPVNSHAESLYEPLPHVKLLLVEDNATNQLIARKFLNKWGISPDYAVNGKIAVDKIQENDYDIVLMDLQMPEMDGYEATKIIRSLSDQKYKQLPIVALTASAMLDVINKVTAIGMTDYVTKPFNPSELYSKIVKYTSSKVESKNPANKEGTEMMEINKPVCYELAEAAPVIAEAKEQAEALQQAEVAQILALAETVEVLEEATQFHAQKLFNLSNLAVMSDGDIAFQKEFLGVCIQSFEEFRVEYRSALLSQNTPQIRSILHKMRPALQLMNILALDPVIEQGSQLLLESAVDTDSLNHIVRQMEAISKQIIRELEITAQALQ